MTAGTLPGCKIELPRTACVAKVHVIFLKDGVRGPAEWCGVSHSPTCSLTFWIDEPSHPFDFAKEVISSDYSCLKHSSHLYLPHWDVQILL